MDEKVDLKQLWILQTLDASIDNQRREKEKLPLLLNPFRENWEQAKAELEERKKNHEGMLVERKSKEAEVTANEEQIKKLNIQLYSLKTNKEYQAMMKEIDNLKKKNKDLDDAVLEIMEKTEAYASGLQEKEKEVKAQEETYKKEQETVDGKMKAIDEELGKLSGEREAQRIKIGEELYRQYEKIRQGKGGLGIVVIDNNSCGGCNINLPPQVINEVKMKKLVFCGSCARLLFWNEDNG